MNRILIWLFLLGFCDSSLAKEYKYERTKNIVYKEIDGETLKLDAYIPEGDGPFPAILVVHGGAWRLGSKGQLAMYARSLAKRGYVCFAINYRLAPKYKSPAQTEDCRDAVRWIRQHGEKYKADPERIGAMGYSAGGHLVSMLAVTGLSKEEDPKGIGTKIVAAVAGGAPTDFRTIRENSGSLSYWFGGKRKDKPEAYAADSPNAFVDKNDSPVFFYNGSIDLLVHPKKHPTMGFLGPTQMHESLKKVGVDTGLYIAKGAGHLAMILNLKAQNAGFAFLDKHLKPSNELRVFWLAGQSNMQGQGVVDFDHPKHYNGGKGILKNVMNTSKHADRYKHIVDTNGDWVVRDDVFVHFQTKEELKTGGLSIGYTGYGGKHHIGPEFQLGHLAGEAFDEPVLLIKTAWGGKSIHKDFRPPSAGGTTGEFYTKMLAEYREALAKLGDEFPHLAKLKPVLSGFVWFQGWNDIFDTDARNDYQSNLVHLINDICKEVEQPDLPVVIGELGNDGPNVGKPMLAIRAAQKAAAEALGSNTVFVQTTQFARPAKESPNVTHGHHWYGNAESYFLIGDALGQALLKLNNK
jgi:acetyl esterase/lipase